LQQAFKHINKSIIYANVSTYLSQFIAVGCVKVSGSDLLKFLIQGLCDVALFQMVKATFCNGILLASSWTCWAKIMVFYFQKLVNFVPLYQRLTTLFQIQ